ncbi:hypothetical protein AA313_de0207841 [Arthrobotrys entomopaga]|nr:hypothetical protein AA313_de0207841 [Arthrobotrys entomopaga]
MARAWRILDRYVGGVILWSIGSWEKHQANISLKPLRWEICEFRYTESVVRNGKWRTIGSLFLFEPCLKFLGGYCQYDESQPPESGHRRRSAMARAPGLDKAKCLEQWSPKGKFATFAGLGLHFWGRHRSS